MSAVTKRARVPREQRFPRFQPRIRGNVGEASQSPRQDRNALRRLCAINAYERRVFRDVNASSCSAREVAETIGLVKSTPKFRGVCIECKEGDANGYYLFYLPKVDPTFCQVYIDGAVWNSTGFLLCPSCLEADSKVWTLPEFDKEDEFWKVALRTKEDWVEFHAL
jgi:hypothetical protein